MQIDSSGKRGTVRRLVQDDQVDSAVNTPSLNSSHDLSTEGNTTLEKDEVKMDMTKDSKEMPQAETIRPHMSSHEPELDSKTPLTKDITTIETIGRNEDKRMPRQPTSDERQRHANLWNLLSVDTSSTKNKVVYSRSPFDYNESTRPMIISTGISPVPLTFLWGFFLCIAVCVMIIFACNVWKKRRTDKAKTDGLQYKALDYELEGIVDCNETRRGSSSGLSFLSVRVHNEESDREEERTITRSPSLCPSYLSVRDGESGSEEYQIETQSSSTGTSFLSLRGHEETSKPRTAPVSNAFPVDMVPWFLHRVWVLFVRV